MTSHWKSRKRKTATKFTFLSVVDSGRLHVFGSGQPTLAVYNPDRDQDDKTLRAGLRIIELLAEEAAKEIG
jgi:hypothetical protein